MIVNGDLGAPGLNAYLVKCPASDKSCPTKDAVGNVKEKLRKKLTAPVKHGLGGHDVTLEKPTSNVDMVDSRKGLDSAPAMYQRLRRHTQRAAMPNVPSNSIQYKGKLL